ncbi:uncharacterized protein LOC142348530 [Convolutriloba macropyga]|uniref:uncharacterized protein LOC142348530 n=1 Tax=Convolutriloba macropyga TaxID=536237 RepID=UPI003F51BEDA
MTTIGASGAQRLGQCLLVELLTHGGWGTEAESMTTIGTSGAQRLGQCLIVELLTHGGWVSDQYWNFRRTEAGSVTTIGSSSAEKLNSNPLTENENNLAVRIINGSFFLEGVMTNNTISESIDVEVTRAIEYLRVAARRRRDVNFDDYPSQSLTIVECPVDDCVNSSSYKLQNLDLGPAEPGTLYEFKIHGTNGLLPGRDVKILYATGKEKISFYSCQAVS